MLFKINLVCLELFFIFSSCPLTLLVVMNYERHLLVRIPLQHSHFEEPQHCNSLLVGVTDCVIWKLQGVQNAAARMITGTCKFDHVTPILRELHWLPVAQRIQYKIAMLVTKCMRGLAPSYLAELCRPVVHLTGCRHLRSAASSKLDVQRTATAIGRRELRCFRSGDLEQFTS